MGRAGAEADEPPPAESLPPPTPLPRAAAACRGLWAIGVLAIITSIFGLGGGCCRARCCLGVYTVLAVLATLAQAGFVLYLFIDPAHAEQEVAKYQRARDGVKCVARWESACACACMDGGLGVGGPNSLCCPLPTNCRDNLHDIIIYGRWGLLGLLGAQVLAIGVAALLRCCGRHRSYEEFQEEEEDAYEARRVAAAVQLDQLKSKLGMSAEDGNGSKRVISESAGLGEVMPDRFHLTAGRVARPHTVRNLTACSFSPLPTVADLTAVSGSAADRMRATHQYQQQQYQQQTSMRSVLFQRSGSEVDDAKLESEMEAGKISSRWEAGPLGLGVGLVGLMAPATVASRAACASRAHTYVASLTHPCSHAAGWPPTRSLPPTPGSSRPAPVPAHGRRPPTPPPSAPSSPPGARPLAGSPELSRVPAPLPSAYHPLFVRGSAPSSCSLVYFFPHNPGLPCPAALGPPCSVPAVPPPLPCSCCWLPLFDRGCTCSATCVRILSACETNRRAREAGWKSALKPGGH